MHLWVMGAAAALHAAAPAGVASSAENDYNLSLDGAERTMVFARSEADFRNARIYTAERVDGGWSEPRPIGFAVDGYSDSDPWLTPDGQTIYFISDRPAPEREAGRTDYDVWRARRTAEGWSAPERLGPEVNGRGQELGPELHGGVLYFASARRSGKGGLDIYTAKASGDGFEPAALIDGPFNTAESDSDFTLSADGRWAMFWRTVEGRGLIHLARREGAGWQAPVPLPAQINRGPFNFTPSFSSDGRTIRFATTVERPGQPAGHADIAEAAYPVD